MLGSLARWLRLLGFDSEYEGPAAADEAVAARAVEDGRWLLTRDRELAAAGPRSLLVRSAGLEDQLVEVLGRLRLAARVDLELARCSECNGGLEAVEAHAVSDRVPPYVLATAPRFRRCARCGRVYWPGTHSERILARLRRVALRLG